MPLIRTFVNLSYINKFFSELMFRFNFGLIKGTKMIIKQSLYLSSSFNNLEVLNILL